MRLFRTTYDMSIDINEFITRIVLNGKLIVEEPNVVEIINGNYCAVGKRALCMTKPPIQFEITKPIHNAAICEQEAFEFLFWDLIKEAFRIRGVRNNLINRPVFNLTLCVPQYTIDCIKGFMSHPPFHIRIEGCEFVNEPMSVVLGLRENMITSFGVADYLEIPIKVGRNGSVMEAYSCIREKGIPIRSDYRWVLLNDIDLIDYFKGIVLLEKHLFPEGVGSATNAKLIYKTIRERHLDDDCAISDWAVQHNTNPYFLHFVNNR